MQRHSWVLFSNNFQLVEEAELDRLILELFHFNHFGFCILDSCIEVMLDKLVFQVAGVEIFDRGRGSIWLHEESMKESEAVSLFGLFCQLAAFNIVEVSHVRKENIQPYFP
jgi:hypothetical protein